MGDVKSGIKYREVRQYDNGTTLLKFYFVTRCFSDHVESVLNELKAIQPHVVIMNSCLWDLHRYGPRGPEAYRSNMTKLIHAVKKVIPDDGVFIWNATMPLASKCKGGFLLPLFENIPSQEILAANYIACSVVRSLRFIFLDLHSIFVNQLHLRANDGIHWNSIAHRRVSNLILHQLCRMWNLPVPNRLIGVPLLPTPPLLGIRPLSRSFSCNSNLDRSYIPYEVDSPVVDKRYVVERSDDEDLPSSNRNRFRLISTPVFTLSTPRSSTKTVNENCSGFDPREKENTPLPLFASSPIESSFKTPSLKEASKASSSMIGASPNLPAARPSLLGDSPYDTGSSQSKGGHYSLDKSSGSQFASSTSVAGSTVALAGGSTVEIEASVSGIGGSNTMVGVMVSEAESSPSDVAALPSQAGVTISQIETLVPLGEATYSKETSTVAWSSPSVASTSHLQVGTSATLVKVLTSLVGTMSSINKNSVPSLKASENQLGEEPLLLNEKPLVEDKHLVLSEKKRLSFSDGMSIVASLHGEGHSVTEEKCSLLEEGAKPLFLEKNPTLLGDKPSLQADKSTLLADKPTVIESKSSLSGNVFKPLIKVELLGDRSSPAGEERSAIAAPLQSLESTDDSVFSPIRCTSPLIAAVPDQDVVAAHPAGAETLVSAVIPCQNNILCQSESAPPSVQVSSLEVVPDGDDDINEQNLREMLLLSQKVNRELKSKKRKSEELNNSNDIFDQSSGKRLRTEVGDPQIMKSRQISSSAEKGKSTKRVVQSVVSSIKDQYSKSTEKQNSPKSASKVETAKANVKEATMARDTCSQSRQGTKRRASDNSEYSHSHKHSKVEEKSTPSQSKHQSLSASCVQSTTKTMSGVVSRKRKISDCISHQSKFLKNNSHQRSATNSKDNTSSSSDVSNVTQHTSGLSNKKNGPSYVGSKSSHKSQSPSHVSEPAHHIDNTASSSTSLHDGRKSTRHETTSSHANELSCNASNPNFKVPNVPGKPTTNSTSVCNKKRRRTNRKHQRSISMGASIPVVSLSLPQYLNANWANQLANTTSQINNTGNPMGYRSNQTTNTGNPMTNGRQMNTTGNPMTVGRQMNTTGNPMNQAANLMISRGNQLAYSRQRSYTGNPMISNRAQSQMCQAARYMANTGNPMTQDQIAQQQMLFNMALHRRRSYPPANPYMNSYNDYYQHDNQRY